MLPLALYFYCLLLRNKSSVYMYLCWVVFPFVIPMTSSVFCENFRLIASKRKGLRPVYTSEKNGTARIKSGTARINFYV